MTGERRVLVIGLDGGSLDLIRPWVDQGFLPALGSLLQNGSAGPLRSTMPPMTFPAWNSFMTGVNPGKHGLFDFMRRTPGTHHLDVNNALNRKMPSIWQILSHHGKRCASCGVPVTYPPESINGAVISGFDAPYSDARMMFPPDLYDEIAKEVGPYIISAEKKRTMGHRSLEQSLEAMCRTIERKGAAFRYLYQREPWDFFMFVFGETDAVVHHYWNYHDEESPFHDGDAAPHADPVLTVYQAVDRQIGLILERLHPGTDIMVMSDHGVGGTGDHGLSLNNFFASEGFLTFDSGPIGRMMRGAAERLKTMIRFHMPRDLMMWLRFRKGSKSIQVEARLRYGAIDWSKTTVFADETPYYPAIWINRSDREPNGIVPPADVDDICHQVIERLTSWVDPLNGEPVVKRVYRKEELYCGKWMDLAPDLIVSWNEPEGYSYLFRQHYLAHGGRAIERVPSRILKKSITMSNRSGSHRDCGVLILCGPHFQRGVQIQDVSLIDLTPTVCALLDIPLNDAFDGNVLFSLLQEEAVVNLRSQSYEVLSTDPDKPYDSLEEREIRQRLRDLGYLE